ncbi:Kelch-like protein diablo [Aphelenchoides bicaudatus]|nr:Kelch-like protein diablo [Aphelenchoides bicaudatus]
MAEFRERLWQLHQSNVLDGECTIRTTERDFIASKVVLACSSGVFEDELKEGLDFLEVNDFSAGVIDQIIEFCYRGKIDNVEFYPRELFLASKAYNITALQNLASDSLGSSINQENLLERLLLAFESENDYLKKKIWAQLKILSSRLFINLLKSSEFHQLYETNSSLYQNIMTEGFRSLGFSFPSRMGDSQEESDSQFRDNLKQATCDGFTGSYTIIAGGQPFEIAKNVFAAQSEYFRGLFNRLFPETAQSVPYDDISAEIMELLVDFMYRGKLQTEDPDIIAELLKLSDRFLIDNLKKFCAKQLANTISTETFVDREEICKKLRSISRNNTASRAFETEEWHIFFNIQLEDAKYVMDKRFPR